MPVCHNSNDDGYDFSSFYVQIFSISKEVYDIVA